MMLDRAIGEFLRKDEAWQAEKASSGSGDDAAEDCAGEAAERDAAPPPRTPGAAQSWRQSSPAPAARVAAEATDASAKGSPAPTAEPNVSKVK
ncbi:MAG TPA: hypothetical protein VGF45_15400 [Polyangia bacterium]